MRSVLSRFVRCSVFALAPALVLVSCGQAERSPGSEMAAPDVTGSSVASRVAFVFNYTFALPPRAISRVQREHVGACEQLGPARCQITGIAFDQDHDKSASGSLSLLVAPPDAYRFAGRAVDLVEAARGEIESADVEGRDAGGQLQQVQRATEDARAEIARLEARLKTKELTEGERRDLNARLEQLHTAKGEQTVTRRENQDALATTPVSFRYVSHSALTGDNRFLRAAGQSWNGVQDALIVGVILLGYLLPWALLIGAVLYGVRWFKRRGRKAEE